MANHYDHPCRYERVHAKHLRLHGALCRVRVLGGPWVTSEFARVTCLACLKRLAYALEVAPSSSMVEALRVVDVLGVTLSQVARQMVVASELPATHPARIHARCQRYGGLGRSLCGLKRAYGVPFATDANGVTCMNCQRMLMNQPNAPEVHHAETHLPDLQ